DGNGKPSDYVGWNFAADGVDRDPSPTTGMSTARGREHGTQIAGIIGQSPLNAASPAGAIWHVSIVPIRASPGQEMVPDVMFYDSFTYADKRQLNIVNVSQGYAFAAEGADVCGLQAADADTRSIQKHVSQGDLETG